jgi:hypothetical protein
MGTLCQNEPVKRLHETIVDLFSRPGVLASACWNIGCFENKRFSVSAAEVISGVLNGLVLTV